MKITTELKSKIAQNVTDWCAQDGRTQAELARLSGVGDAYINIIANKKYTDKAPADTQWSKLVVFFGGGEIHIDSPNYLNIHAALAYAQKEHERTGIDGYTGAGKTYAVSRYAKNNPNVYVITGRRSMGQRALLHELASQVGVDRYKTYTMYELEKEIVKQLLRRTSPLIVFDEMEYVKPACLFTIKTLCDLLEGKCGIVLCGIIREELKKQADRGKLGFPQLFRRFDFRWEIMEKISASEIRKVCKDYGVTDGDVVKYLTQLCKDYDTFTTALKECVKRDNVTVEYLKTIFKDL